HVLYNCRESIYWRHQTFIDKVLSGLRRKLAMNFRRLAMSNRIADDCITIRRRSQLRSPYITASIASSRVNLKRVVTTHTSSFPDERMSFANAPNGAER